ncbi:uncharacterized protein LOC101744940 isoform X2 [Bombyx mori]|uniref:SEFIR domain-containing protein n=1 Tax=Bombyx mori TaxID=7091 RepID=A0A8R2LZM6_BOMMO|nr:uncharacterized protein LOC101744940 isoform X2 [Bombyx mori]
MLTTVIMLFLAKTSLAYEMRCSDQKNESVSFMPSNDGVMGRYVVEVCMKSIPNPKEWALDLMVEERARTYSKTLYARKPGETHSMFKAYYTDENFKELNCTHVCLTLNFEMIFSSCYLLVSVLTGDYTGTPYLTYHNITNNYTRNNFSGEPIVSYYGHEKFASIDFYTAAPPDLYDIFLCPKSNLHANCLNMMNNCTITFSPAKVHCSLSEAGCHILELSVNEAPWKHGMFKNQSNTIYEFCWRPGSAPTVSGWGGGAAWLAGAVLAAAALLLLGCRLRASAHFRKRVLYYWTRRSETAAPPPPPPRGAPVLLLYAREGAAGQRVVNSLRDLLQATCGVKVQDVYSAEWQRACGADPAGALRAALEPRGCARLVLLQTPALGALHAAPAAPDAGPLLGERVLYRAPHFADTLLPYALRLLVGTAHLRAPYRRLYLATLTDLDTDVFPQLVPYVRYRLPDALPALLRDLGAGPEPAAGDAHDQLAAAIQEFVVHVRNNPDYLTEELVLVS